MPSLLFVAVAGLYAAACALHVGVLGRGTAAFGTVATRSLTLAVALHAVLIAVDTHTGGHHASIHHALEVASLAVGGLYLSFLAWTVRSERGAPKRSSQLRVLGAFITPLILLFFLGAGLRRDGAAVSPEVRSFILPIHVAVNVLGSAFFALAFAVSVAYVLQDRQLRSKKTSPILSRLPSLESLDQLSLRMVIAGFPLLTAGVVTGTLWAVRLDPDAPPIGATQSLALVAWSLFGAVLLLRAAVGFRGRRAAVITMLGFACTCVVLLGYVLRGTP